MQSSQLRQQNSYLHTTNLEMRPYNVTILYFYIDLTIHLAISHHQKIEQNTKS